jgi:hypothetical protein
LVKKTLFSLFYELVGPVHIGIPWIIDSDQLLSQKVEILNVHFPAMFRFPAQAEADFEPRESPEIQNAVLLDFPLTQKPNPTPSPVDSQSSQPQRSDGTYRFWRSGKESVLRFSQMDQATWSQGSDPNPFIGSQVSPTFPRGSSDSGVEFCWQIHPPTFPWTVFDPMSPACAPRYRKSYLSRMRRDDMLYNPRGALFAQQTDIDPLARAEQVHWIIRHVPVLEISSKTIFLCVKLLDRLLVSKHREKAKLRLLTVSCLELAAKVESQIYPHLRSYVALSDEAFGEEELLAAELEVMQDLGWQTNATTPVLYLKMWVNALAGDIELSLTAVFVALCALVPPELATEDCELVAVAELAVALHARGMNAQPPQLADVFGRFGADRVRACAAVVVEAVHQQVQDEESPIREMFSIPERGEVALRSFACPPIE